MNVNATETVPLEKCAYNYSTICYTHNGSCATYLPTYQPEWFLNCINTPYGILCPNVLTLYHVAGPPIQTCFLRGTPCLCHFGVTYSGHYIYQYGQIL